MKSVHSILIILVFLIPLSVFTQNETIFASEQNRFDAQLRQNTDALDDLLANELVYIHSNTLTETKTDFINSIESAKIVYQEMNIIRQQLRRYKKIAIITGLVNVKGLFLETPFSVDLHYTSIYKKKKGEWLLLSWQSTSKK